jgi:uncharacterized protein (DUF58 family)
MIVPRDTLLTVFAAVAIPAGLLAAAAHLAPFAAALVLIMVIVAAADAVTASRRIAQLRISTPELVRFTRARAGTIPLVVRNSGAPLTHMRVGVAIPEDVGCARTDLVVPAPHAGAAVEVRIECSPRRRGTYVLDTAALGIVSPLRLWEARMRSKIRTEVRVYPDLLTGQEAVTPLLLRRQTGLHVQRQVGRGREFEKLREYLPGDAMSDIQWKATARRGHPVTRVYQIERTQEIYAVLDCSRLTARPAGSDNIVERYVSAALALTLASRQQGDLFGLVTFSDAIHAFLRAGSGIAHYDACRNALLDVKVRRSTPDYAEVVTAIQSRLRRRAMLVFLTELDDPVLAEDFYASVRELSRRHLVTVASVRPASAAPVFEIPVHSATDVYDRLAGHFAWRRFEDVRTKLRAIGVRFAAVDAAQLGLEVARTYLNVKRQQIV